MITVFKEEVAITYQDKKLSLSHVFTIIIYGLIFVFPVLFANFTDGKYINFHILCKDI
jgi:hypothetical protein